MLCHCFYYYVFHPDDMFISLYVRFEGESSWELEVMLWMSSFPDSMTWSSNWRAIWIYNAQYHVYQATRFSVKRLPKLGANKMLRLYDIMITHCLYSVRHNINMFCTHDRHSMKLTMYMFNIVIVIIMRRGVICSKNALTVWKFKFHISIYKVTQFF